MTNPAKLLIQASPMSSRDAAAHIRYALAAVAEQARSEAATAAHAANWQRLTTLAIRCDAGSQHRGLAVASPSAWRDIVAARAQARYDEACAAHEAAVSEFFARYY